MTKKEFYADVNSACADKIRAAECEYLRRENERLEAENAELRAALAQIAHTANAVLQSTDVGAI